MKKFDYEHIKESKLYDFLRPLGKFVVRLFFKVKYYGQENIPATGGCIVACNHADTLDPLVLAMGIKNRQMHFMAKKELFEYPVLGFFYRRFNAFPIARGHADSRGIEFAKRIPKEGYLLGIFPEGTRSKDGLPHAPKRGISTIVAESKCDIIPVSIFNGDHYKKHTVTTVKFGKPIKYEELGMSDEPTKEEQNAAAAYIMDKIVAQWGEGHCE